MLLNRGKLKSATIILDGSNKVSSLIADGLSKHAKSYLNKELNQLFFLEAYEIIESLAIKSLVNHMTFTDTIAIDGHCIYDVSVYFESDKLHVELNRQNNHMDYGQLLHEISKTTTRKNDIEHVFSLMNHYMDLDRIILMTHRFNDNQMICSEWSEQTYKTYSLKENYFSNCLYKWYENQNNEKAYIVCENVKELEDVTIRNMCYQKDVQAFIMIPIYSGNQKQGVISFMRAHNCSWCMKEIHMLHALSLNMNLEQKNSVVCHQLMLESRKLDAALNAISEGIIITDKMGCIEIMNLHAKEILEITSETHHVKDLKAHIECYSKETMLRIQDPVTRVLHCDKSIKWGHPFLIRLNDSTNKIIDCCADQIVNDQGELLGIVVLFWDMTSQLKREDKLNYLSKYDEMTGLYNRHFMEMEILSYDCDEHYPLTIIMGDLNGLKLTNDAYGHEYGDQMLRDAGKIFQGIVNDQGIASRWGGDEFLLLMPNMNEQQNGQFCSKIKTLFDLSDTQLTYNSISLGYSVKENAMSDLSKHIREAEDYMYNRKLTESQSLRSSVINSIKQTLHEKSYETDHHAQRMALLCQEIGGAMGLSLKEISDLELTAVLHDIGKITINNSILEKPGPLNKDEWEIMKRHCESGYRILKAIPELSHISEYVLSHHERWDGSGYPHGRRGYEIPLISRIVSVADAYDAMTHDRIYRKEMPSSDAIDEIVKHAGRQFDPEVVDAFLDVVGIYAVRETQAIN